MPADQVTRKTFTVDEANRCLPLVRAIVRDIVDLYRNLQERRARLTRVRTLRGNSSPGPLYTDELDQVERELQTDEGQLAAYILELHELGVEFKDPERGLVDFPSRLDDRPVLLCWQLGEPEVAYWHEVDAGFAGRRSLMATATAEPQTAGEDSLA